MTNRRPFRKVIRTENLTTPHNRRGEGSRCEYLDCGHYIVVKRSRKPAKKRRCWDCPMEAR